jgi:hypothetical protein
VLHELRNAAINGVKTEVACTSVCQTGESGTWHCLTCDACVSSTEARSIRNKNSLHVNLSSQLTEGVTDQQVYGNPDESAPLDARGESTRFVEQEAM